MKYIAILSVLVMAGCGSTEKDSAQSDPDTVTGAGGTTADPDPPAGGAGGEMACPSVVCSEPAALCISCVDVPDHIPHVFGAFTGTDTSGSSSATLRFEDGAVCVSGTSADWVALVLNLSEVDESMENPASHFCEDGDTFERDLFHTFDAAAAGIERVQFTVDSPPSAGINIQLVGPVADDPRSTDDCLSLRTFVLMDGSAWVNVSESRAVDAALEDFGIASWEDPAFELDLTQLGVLKFVVDGNVGEFDFCIRDLRLLDANGEQVL